jgi:hypothetical protein
MERRHVSPRSDARRWCRPTGGTRRGGDRASARWGVGVLVSLAVIAGWGEAAGAEGGPDEVVTTEVQCLKPVTATLPGRDGQSVGGRVVAGIAEQQTPVVGTYSNAQRVYYVLRMLGIDIPGTVEESILDLLEPVRLTAPRWYVDQARSEAVGYMNCALARQTPTGSCARLRQEHEAATAGPSGRRELEGSGDRVEVPNRNGVTGFLPDRCWGPYPADAYDIHYDDGGLLSWDREAWATLTGLFHAIGKASIQIALGLLELAFATFRVLDYQDVALTAAARYQSRLVGPFGLVDIAWLVLLGFAAVRALAGKLGIAGGEIVTSLVFVTLAAVLMSDRAGYLQGTAETMDALGTSILAAGNDWDPSARYSPEQTLRPVQETLFVEFIDRPFDYINFGGRIDDDTPECLARRNRILEANVPGDGGWGIRYMAGGGAACEDYALAMGRPTSARMVASLVTAIVAVAVGVVVGGASLVMLMAKVLVLVLFALMPFAAVGSILPGVGRRLAWGWVGTLVQAMLASAGMSFLLSLFLLAIQAVIRTSDDSDPFQRWVVMLLVVGVMYLLRLRIVAGTRTAANQVADALTRLSPASRHWQGSGAAGVDLLTADRRGGQLLAYGAAQGPLLGVAAGAWVSARVSTGYGRWRSGRVTLGNLRKMARYNERSGHLSGTPGMFNRASPLNVVRKLFLPTPEGGGHGHHGHAPKAPPTPTPAPKPRPRPGGPPNAGKHYGPPKGPGPGPGPASPAPRPTPKPGPQGPVGGGVAPGPGPAPQGPLPRTEVDPPASPRPASGPARPQATIERPRNAVVRAWDNSGRWRDRKVDSLEGRWRQREAGLPSSRDRLVWKQSATPPAPKPAATPRSSGPAPKRSSGPEQPRRPLREGD